MKGEGMRERKNKNREELIMQKREWGYVVTTKKKKMYI